jgi:hypothetical protein
MLLATVRLVAHMVVAEVAARVVAGLVRLVRLAL